MCTEEKLINKAKMGDDQALKELFFLYKRLNAAIVNDKGTLRPMTLQESMFPVPADIK